MATAVTADTYLQQIHTARTQLLECFRRAHELLAEREAQLLRQLETIQNDYETETNSQKEELQGLEVSKQSLKDNLLDNDLINEERILKISSGTARTIKFQWDTEFDRNIQHAGKIVTTTPQPADLPVIHQTVNLSPVIPDYKNKITPVIAWCKLYKKRSKGTAAPGELYRPNGLAVEPQSGIIYIANQGNSRVQVFTPDGEYSFMFRSYMNIPWGICINNDTVYVSQWWGHCIVSYKLDGTYVNKVGRVGPKNGQFINPRGLAVSAATGLLYVCDSNNQRVQVFDKDLKFNAILSNKFRYPRDIKLTNELVIVLDEDNPCIHIFSIADHSLINSVISHGECGQISKSLFFCMDAEQNLLITDFDMHCVKIFSLTGEFIAEIGKEGHKAGEFIRPTGIAIDGQNRIIVVSENSNASLQIF